MDMHRARIIAVAAAALLAVTAAALAAWWMTGRARGSAETPSDGARSARGEVVIEIPRGAGPTSLAQLDTIAPLDPGRVVDAGAPSEAAEPAPPKRATPRARR